jgi:hypothetical protein
VTPTSTTTKAAKECEIDGSNRSEPVHPEGRGCRLFGLTIAGDFPFTVRLLSGNGFISLSFLVSSRPLLSSVRPAGLPIYASFLRGKDGGSLGSLYRGPEGEIFRFPGTGDFRIGSDRIDSYLAPQEDGLAELRVLGPVMSYWLELRGLLTLHAAAVEVAGRAVALVSRHGGGKSGLAAGMITSGAFLLTDDVLALEERDGFWEVRPSYPMMRMWPDEAEFFFGDYAGLPRVQRESEKRSVMVGEGGFGRFQEASRPLACIYLATRVEGAEAVEIQPVSRSEALIELVRHSFSPRLVEAVGLQPARLDRLARLVRSVPVRRLVYPSGFERLEEVTTKILRAD